MTPTGRFLASLSRRRVTTVCGLVVPIFLIGAGRWIVWDQLERATPLASRPSHSSLNRQASMAVSVTALLPGHATATPTPDPAATAQAAIMREALNWVEQAQNRYAQVDDYTCRFIKRERLAPGRDMIEQSLEMKVATQPLSIYFRYLPPGGGREAIWVDGRHDNKVLVHEGGLARMLAGTLKVDPRSRVAMNENRHPITEAGIGFLISELAAHWPRELDPITSKVAIERDQVVNGRPCILIECEHPFYDPSFIYHKVRVTLDQELALPVRFQAYDWPPDGGTAELIEDYSYEQLQVNVGLQPLDFDPANPAYQFGRF